LPHASSTSLPKTSEVEAPEDSEQLPVTSYQLEQNYPNPFSQIPRFAGNPGTTISFALAEASRLSVAIYSITGRRVRELVNSEMNAGRHAIRWDGRDHDGNTVAAGIYFYRLIVMGANGEIVFTQTRRMALVK